MRLLKLFANPKKYIYEQKHSKNKTMNKIIATMKTRRQRNHEQNNLYC